MSKMQILTLVQAAFTSGLRLRTLLNTILSVRPSDGMVYTTEQVMLAAVIHTAINVVDVHDEMLVREIKLHVPADLVLSAEALRVQQIFTNLVSNAVKYSPPGSPIEITAIVQGTMARIAVHDHGAGITAEDIPLLFNRFTRLPQHLHSTIIGTGLGLYICRHYAEGMGGRIWVESSGIAGEGCTFFVELPVPVAMPALT
jgi:signal transduction histidine kinase